MERYHLTNNNDLISIGELAKLYNISKRTLRLYHEIGLLEPQFVDEQTGYRYYSQSQFPRLDIILQMKSSGLELKQIKQILSSKNISLFEAVLGEQIDQMNKKIAECQMYKDSLTRKLDSCKHIQNPPILNSTFIEYIPRRSAFIYPIDGYDLKKDYPNGSPWESGLNKMKGVFIENDVPLALFNQIGCIISRESLLQNEFICNGAFILLNDDYRYQLPKSSIIPGTYVCIYHKYSAMNNVAEQDGIRLLLDYVKENHYEILGPCITQVVAEASIFDYSDTNILVKQQIPIRITS